MAKTIQRAVCWYVVRTRQSSLRACISATQAPKISRSDGSNHEDADGHCRDPGVQGGSVMQDVGPAVGGSVAGSTGADGGFDMQDGGPADGGPAIQSKLAFIYI